MPVFEATCLKCHACYEKTTEPHDVNIPASVGCPNCRGGITGVLYWKPLRAPTLKTENLRSKEQLELFAEVVRALSQDTRNLILVELEAAYKDVVTDYAKDPSCDELLQFTITVQLAIGVLKEVDDEYERLEEEERDART